MFRDRTDVVPGRNSTRNCSGSISTKLCFFAMGHFRSGRVTPKENLWGQLKQIFHSFFSSSQPVKSVGALKNSQSNQGKSCGWCKAFLVHPLAPEARDTGASCTVRWLCVASVIDVRWVWMFLVFSLLCCWWWCWCWKLSSVSWRIFMRLRYCYFNFHVNYVLSFHGTDDDDEDWDDDDDDDDNLIFEVHSVGVNLR